MTKKKSIEKNYAIERLADDGGPLHEPPEERLTGYEQFSRKELIKIVQKKDDMIRQLKERTIEDHFEDYIRGLIESYK